METEPWKDRIEFSYVGNVSEEYEFHNMKIFPPLAGEDLANVIKKHIYILLPLLMSRLAITTLKQLNVDFLFCILIAAVFQNTAMVSVSVSMTILKTGLQK